MRRRQARDRVSGAAIPRRDGVFALHLRDRDRDWRRDGPRAEREPRRCASSRRASGRVGASSRGCRGGGHAAAADPALFRIFLKDGTALASYGEFARVGDRVVFTMPLGEHRQQLATVGAGEVDWTRTDGYTYSVRAGHYAATHGESDYAVMSTRMARALTEIAQGTNPNDQLRQAEGARRELAEWPARHFGYKADEIRETLGVLDEVIAGLRAKTTNTRFDISLVAGSRAAADGAAAREAEPAGIDRAGAAPRHAGRLAGGTRRTAEERRRGARCGGWNGERRCERERSAREVTRSWTRGRRTRC